MNKPRQDTEWYRETLEQIFRGRIEIIKRKIVESLHERCIVDSFNALYGPRGARIITGRHNEVLLAWQQLRRDKEIVKVFGSCYCLRDDKPVIEMRAKGYGMKKLGLRKSAGEKVMAEIVRIAKQELHEALSASE